MRWPVLLVHVRDTSPRLDALAKVTGDLCEAGTIESLTSAEDGEHDVEVVLSAEPPQ